jgi:hypothetical protein
MLHTKKLIPGHTRYDNFATKKRASILIYVLFLTSFLWLFFVSFQAEVEKLLKTTQWEEKSIQDISRREDALNQVMQEPKENIILESLWGYSLVSLTQNENTFTKTIHTIESDEYWITASGGSSEIALNIEAWWPLSYKLAAFQSGAEDRASLVASGIITNDSTLSLSGAADQHILVIEGLGWQTKYRLNGNNTTLLPDTTTYRTERDINGYKKYEGIYDIAHFTPKSRTGIVYQNLGMYLKE